MVRRSNHVTMLAWASAEAAALCFSDGWSEGEDFAKMQDYTLLVSKVACMLFKVPMELAMVVNVLMGRGVQFCVEKPSRPFGWSSAYRRLWDC